MIYRTLVKETAEKIGDISKLTDVQKEELSDSLCHSVDSIEVDIHFSLNNYKNCAELAQETLISAIERKVIDDVQVAIDEREITESTNIFSITPKREERGVFEMFQMSPKTEIGGILS